MANKRIYRDTLDAVNRMFSDDVPSTEALTRLEELRDEIDMMIDACKGDIKRRETTP